MGDTNKIRKDSYRYYVRTGKDGEYIGDTSNYHGSPDDFVYTKDNTCYLGRSQPRK